MKKPSLFAAGTALCTALCASVIHAGPPEILMPGSAGYMHVVQGAAAQRPRLDVEAAVDRMMPEMVDLPFVDLIRDYHRASLSPKNLGPGDLMRLRLAERHAAAMPTVDPERIREMANIDMVEEYRPEMTLEIRNGNYELGPDGALTGDLGTSVDLEAFLATADGIKMVSGMTEPQFNALTQLLREMKAEEQLLAGDGGLAVGDGTNLALQGWRVDYDGSEVRIYHETTPGSGLIAETGMVMGEFGRIMDIRISGQDVAIIFETGETLESRGSDLLADGIPAIGDNLTAASMTNETSGQTVLAEADVSFEEIIVTRRTERVADASESGLAPTTSLRPRARPETAPQADADPAPVQTPTLRPRPRPTPGN